MAQYDPTQPFDPAALDALNSYRGVTTNEYVPPKPPPPPPPPNTLGVPGATVTDEQPNQSVSAAFVLGGEDPAPAHPGMSFDNPATLEPSPTPNEIPVTPGQQIATPDFTPPKQLTRQQADAVKGAQRDYDLNNDPIAFSKNGGVVSGPAEQAKLEGSVADTQAQAYLAGVDASKIAAAREREKQAMLLQIADKNYKEYSSEIASIDRNARQVVEGQKKRAQEIADKQIEPHGVFNQRGALGGIMWALGMMAASQTKNSSASMGMLMEAADAMINRDIKAQGENINNQWKGFEASNQATKDEYNLDMKGLANLATQQQVRYAMVEKALDMKIAAMGNPAAERAGLLNVKAAIGDKLAKSQMHFQDQVFTAGESLKQRQNAIYLERMREDHDFAMKKMEKEDATLENGVMTGEKTGLYATDAQGNQKFAIDKKTGQIARDEKGQPVPITIQAQKGKADELGKVFEGANKYYSNLLIIKDELAKMTPNDLVTGHYTDRYRAAVVEAGYAKALQINGSRPTDDDFENGKRVVQGFDPQGSGVLANMAHVFLGKGNTIENMRGVVDTNIAKISGETVDSAQKFMRGDQVQGNSFIFKPKDLNVKPASDTRSDAEVISGYTKDKKLVKDAADKIRAPFTKEGADKVLEFAGTNDKAFQSTLDSYKSSELRGTLPKLPTKDQEFLDRAKADMAKSDPARVKMLYGAMKSGLQDGTIKISDEARFRLAMEAADAFKSTAAIASQAKDSGVYESPGMVKSLLNQAANTRIYKPELKEGEDYNDALTKYLNSDEWQLEKKRLGIK